MILAVPIFDTGYVIAKRIKYRRPVYKADKAHLHHRLARIGFSPRRTALYLYGWTLSLASLALALRFVPYSDDHGNFHWEWVRSGRSLVRSRRALPVLSRPHAQGWRGFQLGRAHARGRPEIRRCRVRDGRRSEQRVPAVSAVGKLVRGC